MLCSLGRASIVLLSPDDDTPLTRSSAGIESILILSPSRDSVVLLLTVVLRR